MQHLELTEAMIAWALYYIAYSSLFATLGNSVTLGIIVGDMALGYIVEEEPEHRFTHKLFKIGSIFVAGIMSGYRFSAIQIMAVSLYGLLIVVRAYMKARYILKYEHELVFQTLVGFGIVFNMLKYVS